MCKPFFYRGVFILCLGLLLSGCGGSLGNPMTKALAEAGAYAIFSPGTLSEHIGAGAGQGMNNSVFTIEAWVKTTTGGVIFVRGLQNPDTGPTDGFQLSIENSNVNFRLTDSTVTATTYIVTDAVNSGNVTDGRWHHTAGVLVGPLPVGQQHNHVTDLDDDEDPGDTGPNEGGTCSPADTGSIHMDIYVNGIFRDCNGAVILTNLDRGTENIIGFERDGLFGGGVFTGTIDEVRLWKETREEGQINKWMRQEISGEEWDIADPDNSIIGYWKFNEGTGDTALDSSGYGNNGTKLRDSGKVDSENNPIFEPWLDGWVQGYLF